MQGKQTLAYWLLSFVLIATNVGLAQEQDENDPAKALVLVREAIKARGGEAYLKVRATVTRSQFTAYEKGVPGNPSAFVDYLAPNRERTEFGKPAGIARAQAIARGAMQEANALPRHGVLVSAGRVENPRRDLRKIGRACHEPVIAIDHHERAVVGYSGREVFDASAGRAACIENLGHEYEVVFALRRSLLKPRR